MPQQKTLLERVGSFGARDSVIDMTPEEAEANLFEGRDASFSEVIKAYPQTMGPFLALAHNIMDRDGAFTQGEKYLMAGFVGKLLNCSMCRESLESAAISFGVDDGVLSALADNIDTSPVSPALKPVLKYVRKLVLDPSSVERDDTQSILDAGWSKQAIFDANSISGVIGMSARMVMGTHVTNTAENNKNTGQLLATKGYIGMASLHGVDTPFIADNQPVYRGKSDAELSLLPGQRVTLQNLKNGMHNGKTGKVLEYVVHAGNWRVELDNALVIRITEENVAREDNAPEKHSSLEIDNTDNAESSDDEGCPPLTNSPSSYTFNSNVSTSGASVGPAPDAYTQRRIELAASRFQRVQDRMAKDFAAKPVFVSSVVELSDTAETIQFKINTKWEKGRKALFAKAYTKLYKDGQRKLRVVVVEDEKKKGTSDIKAPPPMGDALD